MNNKQEWLEKVKIVKNQKISTKTSIGMFSVNTCLYEIPEELSKDEDINYTAAIVGKEYLWNIHQDLRNNKDFILNLINNNYGKDNGAIREIYKYLSDELRADEEIFLKCVERNEKLGKHTIFSNIPDNILENKDLIIKAMKIHDIFESLNNKYDLDKEVMEIHLEKYPEDFNRVKKSVNNYFNTMKRKNIMLKFLKSAAKKKKSYSLYTELNTELANDLDVVDILLTENRENVKYLSKDLLLNRDFILNAIEKYNINRIHATWQNDKEIMTKLIEKDGKNITISSTWLNDIELLKLAIKTFPRIELLNLKTLQNKEIVYEIIKKESSESKVLLENYKNYRDDEYVIDVAVKYEPDLFKLAENINNDEINTFVVNKTKNIDYASLSLLNNKNLIMDLLDNKENCEKAMKNNNFIKVYKNDVDVATKIIKKIPNSIKNFVNFKADKDFVLLAVNCGLVEIEHIDVALYSDKDVAMEFVKKGFYNYKKLPLTLKNDHDIAIEALKNPNFYDEVILNSNLESDIVFHMKLVKKIPKLYEKIDDFAIKNNVEIIINYINNSLINNTPVVLPKKLLDKYNTTDPETVKVHLIKEKLESELQPTENQITSKKKIKV